MPLAYGSGVYAAVHALVCDMHVCFVCELQVLHVIDAVYVLAWCSVRGVLHVCAVCVCGVF